MTKELEALEILLRAKQVCDVSCIEMCNNCQKKSAYNTIEKSLKALEILKKNFEFGLFEADKYKVYIYSSDDDYSVVKRISEEEFNLLKEVLE